MSPPTKSSDLRFAYVGIGLYTLPEAARLLRVPQANLGNWSQGYTYRRNEDRHSVPSLLARDYPELVEARILTFVDLVELYVVSQLRLHKVSMARIRTAAGRLCDRYGTRHPFATRRIRTDGARLFDHIGGTGRKAVYEDLGTFQSVMGGIVQDFFKKLDYDQGVARTYWPLGRGRVVLDPARGFGKPIDSQTGVPTFVLYQAHVAGESDDRISRWYNVTIGAVGDAVRYETQLAA